MKTARPAHTTAPSRATGAVAVELAVVLVALSFILMGIFMYGRLLWQYNVANNLATFAARYAAAGTYAELKSPGTRRDDAKARVGAAAAEVGMTVVNINVSCMPSPDCVSRQTSTAIKAVLAIAVDDPTGILSSDGSFLIETQSVVPFSN
jgi:Flp pilus assembly protein TadG